jgi:5-methylcytosine-specific restriction endonuclease McrA
LKPSSAKKLTTRNPKQFKTSFDDNGRVCTKCLEYKTWDNFFVAKKTASGHQSECKSCKLNKRQENRNYEKEKYSSKKRKQELKKLNPILIKARDLRSSLLRRSQDPGIKQTTPTVTELEKWLTRDEYICYYSGEILSLNDITVDHKVPISRNGTNELENLCIASHHMNTAKGSLTEKEFVELLLLIQTWENKGIHLLRRLKQGWF